MATCQNGLTGHIRSIKEAVAVPGNGNGNGKLWGLVSLIISGLSVLVLTFGIFILNNLDARVEKLDDKFGVYQLEQTGRLVAVEKDVEALLRASGKKRPWRR